MFEIAEDDRAYVYAVVFRILKTHDGANDATQDTLLTAYRCRAQYRGEAAPRTWLYRIAVTTALGHLRSRRRSREDAGLDLMHHVSDPAPSPEAALASRELADHVSTVLAGLDDDLGRRILAMRLDDTSDHDIASDLGLSVGNVRVRACRTRQQLRTLLAA